MGFSERIDTILNSTKTELLQNLVSLFCFRLLFIQMIKQKLLPDGHFRLAAVHFPMKDLRLQWLVSL